MTLVEPCGSQTLPVFTDQVRLSLNTDTGALFGSNKDSSGITVIMIGKSFPIVSICKVMFYTLIVMSYYQKNVPITR